MLRLKISSSASLPGNTPILSLSGYTETAGVRELENIGALALTGVEVVAEHQGRRRSLGMSHVDPALGVLGAEDVDCVHRRIIGEPLIRLAVMFRSPGINIYSHDVGRLATFYEALGFRQTFRTPKAGTPVHIEVSLDGFTIGIATVESARADHGLSPNLAGRPVEILLWTDDVDRDYERLTADGAPSLSVPHDWLTDLRLAWVADPDGNPIQLAQKRRRDNNG